MASENVKDATTDQFDDLVKEGVALVDFWADWCGPCKTIAPVVDQLAETYKDQVTFLKVNIDDEPALANKFGVRGIPTLLILKDSKVVETLVGAQNPITLIEAKLKEQL